MSTLSHTCECEPEEALLLTKEELSALTGTKQAKRMHAWLEARGWVFEPGWRRGDIPRVDRSYYLDRMAGRITTLRRVEPRFERLAA